MSSRGRRLPRPSNNQERMVEAAEWAKVDVNVDDGLRRDVEVEASLRSNFS